MKKQKRPASATIAFSSEREMPLLAVSLGSMLWNRTGSWRYIRPLYHNKTAPCNEACPAGEDVEAVEYLCGLGRYREAWERIISEHPFPAVQGRVCYHPCESACNRGQFDEAISIHSIERFIGDYGLEQGLRPPALVRSPKAKAAKKVAVVGAGPAGLVCAYHLARRGYATVVLEQQSVPGGILRLGIPAYRLPKNILEAEIDLVRQVGVDIQTNSRVDAEVLRKDLKNFQAIFLAPGAHHSRQLGVPGEDLRGVRSGLQFLVDINLGRPVKIGKKVAVIGGGNTAMDAARSALRLGSEVVVIYRRSRSEMPAIPSEVEEAEREGIPLHFLATPVRLLGEGSRLAKIECVKMELGEPDESGRRRPVPVQGSNFTMEVDTVLTAIGESADLSFLPQGIETRWGSIVTDGFSATSQTGIFAGGDVIDQSRTVAHAIGAGKMAAVAIDTALRRQDVHAVRETIAIGGKGAISIARHFGEPPQADGSQVVTFDQLNTVYFEPAPRVPLSQLPVEEAVASFAEVNQGLAEEAARRESGRCFNCGVCNMCENCWVFCPDISIWPKADAAGYDIDYDHCKGCGICVEECPRAAMSMEEEIK